MSFCRMVGFIQFYSIPTNDQHERWEHCDGDKPNKCQFYKQPFAR